ncbi:cation-translocating P-type ATPase [Streptosporangium minutum]|uniref:Magnesium-transporting ATPase n=1 Tax=Streptosporangium minutum TaxID=569862 RepID=A0A243RMX7_9ACTN|nr:cation-translocating P-type ATPase [Streptosporangium minutum]OUC95602.1 magnesium-transporting ATPase [Streptosporangium minutum]
MLLSRVLTLSTEALWGAVPDAIRNALPRPRGRRSAPGGFHIDLRAIGGPGTERVARRLEELLLALDGVERAEVNGALAAVFVGGDVDLVDLDELMSIIDELDSEQDAGEDREPAWGSSLSSVVEQHTRAGLRLGASLVGTGLAFAGRAAHLPPLFPTAPTLLHLAESTPAVRAELERHLGRPATGALFTTANIVAGTLALRPLGLLVQSVSAAGHYAEARGMRRAWETHGWRLASEEGSYRHTPAPRRPRPAPLAHSPVERFERVVAPVALGASGLTRIVGAGHRRGLAMLVATTPRAAKVGREAFSGAVGRALARRGTVVLNSQALRHMDGIDTVVLDAALLDTGSWTIDRVVPLAGDMNADELHARLYALLDLTDPAARRERGTWAAGPLADLAGLLPADAPEWAARGLRPVGVTRRGRLVAVAGLAPEADPLAEAVVAAAKGGCTVVLAGGDRGLARRMAIDEVVPGGSRLAASVRALQAGGHGVAVVSRRSRAALAQADLGIGVLGRSGRVPWDADVIGEFDGIHLLLSCLAPARRTSERCVWLSVAGTAVGATLTAAGAREASVRRAQLVNDCTALAAIALGEWAGREAGRGAPPVGADRTPWHAMPVRDVLSRLGSSPSGISEAEALRRRPQPGPGGPGGPDSLLRVSAQELANPLTPVLAAGAGVSAVVGSLADSALIGTVLIVNALIGGGQRFAADRALHRLTEAVAVRVRLRRPHANVDAGATAGDLVAGDVVELRAGDAVPADCRVLRAVGLEIDEAALTGESQLVAKSPAPVSASAVADRSSMVYQGTTVAAGHGLAVVVAAGEATESARTARLTAGRRPPTGVQLRLRALSRRVLPVAIGSGAVLLAADLLRGRSLSEALAPAVSLAVAAVPEGLPFVASAAELAAARRLSTRNTLVPTPSTIEALGRVNVLCFDKTGTLTEGHISLRRVSDGRAERPVEELVPGLRRVSDGRAEHPVEELVPGLRRIVAAALRASPRHDTGRPVPHPTDRAVLDGARRLRVTPEEGPGAWQRVDELPFEPARGYHAVLGLSGSRHLLSVKGAPEVVFTRCAALLREGGPVPLDGPARAELEGEIDRLARQGYRMLAVAERPASDRRDLDESRIEGLTFLGFLCLADPVRPTAAESVGRLTRAGVRIVMVTGDHPSTAEAIAAELGVLDGARIMTGPELDDLDDDALTKVLPDVTVFARTTPAHKVRIVDCLRRSGMVVAVTGDGANDAPAIRAADVGIALGSRATPAARAAADVVVTDDRIETIVDAIIEGRAMWSSVRDALSILLGGNVGEIVFAVASSLLTGRNVLNARQLLLVNLLTDMLPAMAVAVRPPAATSPERLLAEGPEASLAASLTRDIYLRAAVTAAAAGAAWSIGRMTGTRARADTVGLVALVSAQLFQTLALGGRDRVVALASLASLAVLGLTVSIPGLSRFFGCRPLGPVGWAIAFGSAAVATVLGTAVEASTREMSPPVH